MLNASDIFYTAGAFTGLVSFLIRDILWLRCVYTLASFTFIISGFLFGSMTIVVWNSAIACLNIVQVVLLIIERRPILLPEKLKDIYLSMFRVMTTREFLKVYKRATQLTSHKKLLIKQGELLNNLLFVMDGTVAIIKGGHEIAQLSRGAFLGEMNFLTEKPATASVKPINEVSYLVWSKKDLHRLRIERPNLFIKFQNVIGMDLVNKLTQQYEL